MQDDTLDAFLDDPPRFVEWQEVPAFDRVAERVAAVRAILSDSVGVDGPHVRWAPEEVPPPRRQALAWAWVVRPDLEAAIESRAEPLLREAIETARAGS